MKGEEIIFALLSTSPALAAVVPAARIAPGVIPQGTTLPAIAYSHISSVDSPMLGTRPALQVRSRIQVTVAAGSYAAKKDLLDLVRKACNGKRGQITGVQVFNVRRDIVGPDIDSAEAKVYTQPIDFLVQFREPV
ncbi:MAG: DUF3168 domain-containing protein [Xylophilus ampelinus]